MAVKTTSGWRNNHWSVKTASSTWSTCKGGWVKTSPTTWSPFIFDDTSNIKKMWYPGTLPKSGNWIQASHNPVNDFYSPRDTKRPLVFNGNSTDSLRYEVYEDEWSARPLPYAGNWHKPASGDTFITMFSGSGGRGVWSRDGITWYSLIPVSGAGPWGDLATDGSTYVGVRTRTAPSSTNIVYSADGTGFSVVNVPYASTWCMVASHTYSEFMIASPNANYTLLTKDITSRGGNGTWTRCNLPESENWTCLADIAHGEYFIVGSPTNGTSNKYALFKNGAWTSRRFPVADRWNVCGYWNGVFVVLPYSGTRSLVSLDGETWKEVVLPFSGQWHALTHDDGHFFAFCRNTNRYAYLGDQF